uniref:Ig-like domain-containing protein n=1 Tax=Maylandia zebra TaxID=106582 RepID=A0A3P9DN78_9CICH
LYSFIYLIMCVTLGYYIHVVKLTHEANSLVLYFIGETITVRCEIHGGDTEWDCEWETNSMIKAPNQNEYRIRSASSSNSGNYRCKGRMKSSQHKTTEWSDSVTLTVSDSNPVHPVTEGASVSLSCSLRTQKILSNVFFYHNDKLLQNDPRGELKISAVSKSDEGFYKCQYSGRESAQSWIFIKEATWLSQPQFASLLLCFMFYCH